MNSTTDQAAVFAEPDRACPGQPRAFARRAAAHSEPIDQLERPQRRGASRARIAGEIAAPADLAGTLGECRGCAAEPLGLDLAPSVAQAIHERDPLARCRCAEPCSIERRGRSRGQFGIDHLIGRSPRAFPVAGYVRRVGVNRARRPFQALGLGDWPPFIHVDRIPDLLDVGLSVGW